MSRIRAFGAFAYDFVIGDDWWVAAGVVVALGLTYALSHAAKVAAWWLVPAALVLLLPVSLLRAVRGAAKRGVAQRGAAQRGAGNHGS